MPRRGDRQPAKECTIIGCDAPVFARALCVKHYKRRRNGQPMRGRQQGDPDGYGLYGLLDDDGQTVGCHECDYRGRSLGSHIVAVHEMTAREYKRKHGLPLTRGLLSSAERERMSRKANESAATVRALQTHRDPAAASTARTAESFAAMGLQNRLDDIRHHRTSKPLVETCVVCHERWIHEPGMHRAQTCSEECRQRLLAWINFDPAHDERDQRILVEVYLEGVAPEEVARRKGLSVAEVNRIVRAQRRLRFDERKYDEGD